MMPVAPPKPIRPYIVLLLLAAATAIPALCFFWVRNPVIVFPGWHTYIIPKRELLLTMTGFFSILALVYFLTRHYRQSTFWQFFHIGSLLPPVIFFSPFSIPEVSPYPPVQFLPTSFLPTIEGSILILYCLLGQLAFVINLIAGFIRGKKSPKPEQ